mmetsp:Transcript_19682/g.33092  ORF Transcript_19682/g.33092 Transcript_19682/m.33092 type:complete len:216 (+) Transcript_19682:262-909(+)|eukprot:CAMPEP_0198207928 /NCGR_PEP_ID=MMETSP1445-20131203/11334_1 /TAXON_ID=36898 /ORGANISM="Pyramimonas sp., Strain CCMP2087" /LENGTH=215 /DNA_ID=CAMNT_0043881119 /DNA_START=274 /DNA_END=921 /DNA_ORIENTATION=+
MPELLHTLLMGLALCTVSSVRGDEDPASSDLDELDSNYCSKGCKLVFIGDKNCDKECYHEKCQWDGGDCADVWEVRRTVVMGPFFTEVEHVEYHAVGPGGEKKELTMEEGRHWEGTDTRTTEERANWRRMLKQDEEHGFLASTSKGMPPWYLDKNGARIPAYRELETGVKIAIDHRGDDLIDEDGNQQPWFGVAGSDGKLHGLNYEYDEYYYEDY